MCDRLRVYHSLHLAKPPKPTQPGHPSVGRRNEYTGDGLGHRSERNGEFCITVHVPCYNNNNYNNNNNTHIYIAP